MLRHFLAAGDAPDRAWMTEQARGLGLDVDAAIRQLTAVDLVHVDRAGRVTVAYPFSGVTSGHRVQVAGAPAVWAMCAIDALGIPQMADRDATITAADPVTGEPVTVEAHAGPWTWRPESTVVLIAQTGHGGPSAYCTCGHVNFYRHAEHAHGYLDAYRELTGRVVDQATAVELACGVFGGLLRNPA